MLIHINAKNNKPIYEQIVDQIKENLVREILKPGSKLPSVRELAATILVNPNTVSRAYKELEQEKVIEVIKGRGTYISIDYKLKVSQEKITILKEEMKKIVVKAQSMEIKKKDMIGLLEKVYEELEEDIS